MSGASRDRDGLRPPILPMTRQTICTIRFKENAMPASAAAAKEQPATRFAKDQLKAFVERIERLEEEKKATSDDIRDVYAEAKGTGYDIKALRTIVSLRKQDTEDRKSVV